MKNFKEKIFLLLCFVLIINSCKKEQDSGDPIYPQEVKERLEQYNVFFSNTKTQELLSSATHKWESEGAYSRNEEDIDILKQFIQNFDTELSDKYVNFIIGDLGYPFWNGRYEIQIENDVLIFIPVFQENSTEINGVISCSGTSTGEIIYAIIDRKEMEAELIVKTDPNFFFYTQLFAYFDQQLFGKPISSYDEWIDVAMRDDPLASLECSYYKVCSNVIDINGNGGVSCYFVCTYGCSNELTATEVADTPSELAWISGNCRFAATIDEFLESNGAGQIFLDAAQTFLDIGMAEGLGYSDFESLVITINDFLGDIHNDVNIETLYDYFEMNDLNPFATNGFDVGLEILLPSSNFPNSNWIDFNGQDYLDLTSELQDDLYAEWVNQPSQNPASVIYSLWRCRVLGPSHEVAVLNSLGQPLEQISLPGLSRYPDGYITQPFYDIFAYDQPVIIEVKGVFSGDSFDYSDQIGQFTDYKNWLQDNAHSSSNTIRHGLYMILPANVALAPEVINSCNNQNIPLYYSGVEHKSDALLQFKVKRPELLNINNLDNSYHMFDWLGSTFFKWASEECLEESMDYSEVTIDFITKVNEFEQSYLIGSAPPICDPDD